MNKKYTIMFLLASLIVLLVGISAISAADSTSNATVEQVTDTNTAIENTVADTNDNLKIDDNNNKAIESKVKNVKTEPETR